MAKGVRSQLITMGRGKAANSSFSFTLSTYFFYVFTLNAFNS